MQLWQPHFFVYAIKSLPIFLFSLPSLIIVK